jgi:hypothetical protein
VTENLRVELKAKPYKLLKAMDFMSFDIPKTNADFTRLSVNEQMLPMLVNLYKELREVYVHSILDQLN